MKIVRCSQREGLIRARLIGLEVSLAPVVLYLDSHVECNVGWLEPLLDEIRLNKRTVISPIIDLVDAKDFR